MEPYTDNNGTTWSRISPIEFSVAKEKVCEVRVKFVNKNSWEAMCTNDNVGDSSAETVDGALNWAINHLVEQEDRLNKLRRLQKHATAQIDHLFDSLSRGEEQY